MQIVIAVKDHATEPLKRLHGSLAPSKRAGLMAVLGRTGEKVYRAHFRKREMTTPNKMGWPRQHFWARIAKATAYDASKTTADQAVVAISDPALAAKIDGATIRPKAGRRMLAIPMRAEAYGIMPSSGQIPGLFLLGGKNGGALYLGKRDGGKFNNLALYYRLVPKVVVTADPNALPRVADVSAELLQTAVSYINRNLS